jgi:hypothetical protein
MSHTKVERAKYKKGNENEHWIEAKHPAVTSSQLKEVEKYDNLAHQRQSEEELAQQHEADQPLRSHSHSQKFELDRDCAGQLETGHQVHITEQQVYFILTYVSMVLCVCLQDHFDLIFFV